MCMYVRLCVYMCVVLFQSFDDDTGSDVGHVQGSTSLSGPVLEAEKFPGTVSVTFNPQLPVACKLAKP